MYTFKISNFGTFQTNNIKKKQMLKRITEVKNLST